MLHSSLSNDSQKIKKFCILCYEHSFSSMLYAYFRVMVVYLVSFEEEMERCLARLFLQQFEITQKKVPLTPHIEFRRPNQATTELKQVMQHNANVSNEAKCTMPPAIGFLTFTFFPSSAASEDRRLKAVDLIVNFLPYINKHVKSTKSMMLNRMRAKKDDLLPSIEESVTSISW